MRVNLVCFFFVDSKQSFKERSFDNFAKGQKNHLMKKYFLNFIFIIVTSITYGQSYYYLNDVIVSPSTPTTQDSVSITIKGSLSSTSSYISGITSMISDTSVNIIIEAASYGAGFAVLVPFDTTLVLPPLSVNTYIVNVSGIHVYNDLSDTIIFQVVGSTNTKDLQLNSAIRIYPNPATTYFKIQTTIPISDVLSIELIDIKGRVVQTLEPSLSSIFRLEEHNQGLYFISIQTNKGQVIKKILIE